MDMHSFDHNVTVDAGHGLHADLHTPQDLQIHQDLLSDPTIGVHHDPFNPSSIGVYESNPVHNTFESQHLADYQPNHANGLLDHHNSVDHASNLHLAHDNQYLTNSVSDFDAMRQSIAAGQHPQVLDHNHFLTDSHSDHLSQRLGSANLTPSSPSNISKNKEVTFKDADGHEHSGTVMKTNSNDTYTIQTSEGTYENVAYHDIQKYGSK